MTAKHCGRYVWIRGEDRLCGQTVGLIRWTDAIGLEHAACRAHVGVMQSLYPPTRDPIDEFKAWTEGEKATAWGR